MSEKQLFKYKVAIYFGYNGLPYHGLQIQKKYKTIEGVFEQALLDSQLIQQCNYGDLKKIGWQRSARTDKGVHAICNVCSLKIQVGPQFYEIIDDNQEIKKENVKTDFKKLKNLINSNLPSDIRVFSIKNTTQQFDSYLGANSREYEYVAPVCLFQLDSEDTPKCVERINKMCQLFIGSNKYHNYTRSIHFKSEAARRNVLKMTVDIIKLQQDDSVEFVTFKIHGQSFVYHQIRKMIGILIQISQNPQTLNENFINQSFLQEPCLIWLAPAQGLFLNRVNFDSYNKKKDIPETLISSIQEIQEQDEFKQQIIYPLIYSEQLKNKIFTTWLEERKKQDFIEDISDVEID